MKSLWIAILSLLFFQAACAEVTKGELRCKPLGAIVATPGTTTLRAMLVWTNFDGSELNLEASHFRGGSDRIRVAVYGFRIVGLLRSLKRAQTDPGQELLKHIPQVIEGREADEDISVFVNNTPAGRYFSLLVFEQDHKALSREHCIRIDLTKAQMATLVAWIEDAVAQIKNWPEVKNPWGDPY